MASPQRKRSQEEHREPERPLRETPERLRIEREGEGEARGDLYDPDEPRVRRVEERRVYEEDVPPAAEAPVRPIRPAPPPAERVAAGPAPLTRVRHAVDYLFYILYGLLAIRLVLALMGAREAAGFVGLIRGVTAPFYAPFEGIVSRPAVDGGYLDFPAVIAILAYVLLHLAVRGLLKVIEGRAPGR